MDANGNEVKSYNPHGLGRGVIEHSLAENEELVGVYGVYNKRNSWYYFKSFGFLVRWKAPK